jgi:hypothetical protein
MKKPKTQKQEILYDLINEGSCSIEKFFYMCGFRTRISELKLKHGLNLDSSIKAIGKSKHGNVYTFHIHKLLEKDKAKAIEIYNELARS